MLRTFLILFQARRKCLGLDSYGCNSQQSESRAGGNSASWPTSEQTISFNARDTGEYVERKGPVCEIWDIEKSGSVPELAV